MKLNQVKFKAHSNKIQNIFKFNTNSTKFNTTKYQKKLLNIHNLYIYMASIYTKIINREIPASIIYEDENHIAFLDIAPFVKGHTLIVPKKEYAKFYDMPENEYCELQKVVHKLSKHYFEIFKCNIGSVIYGEDIQHVHIHIFPINSDVKVFDFSKTYSYEEGEAEEFRDKLKLN